jgi:uncharacterized protein (TIGR02996 family)
MTTINAELRRLLKYACDNPEDFDTRLVLADCYEESGDLLRAEAWRYLGEGKKFPLELTTHWWDAIGWKPYGTDDSCRLPAVWVTYLRSDSQRAPGFPNEHQHTFHFDTVSDALKYAVEGYVLWKLSEQEQTQADS